MNRSFILRLLAVLLIVGAGGVIAYALLGNSKKVDQNIIFASHTLLAGTWENYKEEYWESSTGRTLDKQQDNITTSEGQSYTMLRAVWMSDKATFDTAWKWTKEQLKREDSLFAWRWGKREDGTYGVLTNVNGQNAASDADTDIALALLMAASRWQQQSYLDEARTVIKSIYDNEVVSVGGVPYMTSNNLEKQSSQPMVMNLSYLAPYAYREFAKVDKEHNWMALVDSSYDLIGKAVDTPLDNTRSAGLVPDWVLMNRETGELTAPNAPLTTNYGYDAMRTPWRIALDFKWNKEPRAKQTLEKMNFLRDEWKNKGAVYSVYKHDGSVVSRDEVAEGYGNVLALLEITDPEEATKLYDEKIKTLYDQNENKWVTPLSYYASNWVWFGIALHEDQLPNLARELEGDK